MWMTKQLKIHVGPVYKQVILNLILLKIMLVIMELIKRVTLKSVSVF